MVHTAHIAEIIVEAGRETPVALGDDIHRNRRPHLSIDRVELGLA